MNATLTATRRPASGELVKFLAFLRRDLLVAWSYRLSFLSDLISLAALTVVFHFIGMMVDESRLPTYSGTEVTYLEFAVVGLALGLFIQLALTRVAQAIRTEQLMGTLESLLLTPTSLATIQVGSIAFDLVYMPLRTAVFLGGVSLAFGLHFTVDGLLPALAVVACFIPFVWGLGVASAGVILTFRRGSGLVTTAMMGLALVSGVYFPIDLLPGWIADLAGANPVAITIEALREALLGGAGWAGVDHAIAVLAPAAVTSIAIGMWIFRLALTRERERGTIGLY